MVPHFLVHNERARSGQYQDIFKKKTSFSIFLCDFASFGRTRESIYIQKLEENERVAGREGDLYNIIRMKIYVYMKDVRGLNIEPFFLDSIRSS